MREILRINDPVLLSFVTSLLSEAGHTFHIADTNVSIVEGSVGIFPRRLLVKEVEAERVYRLLQEVGLGGELLPEFNARSSMPSLIIDIDLPSPVRRKQ